MEYLEQTSEPFFFFSSQVKKYYTEAPFTENALLVFGSETKGLPPQFMERWPEKFYKIPMQTSVRCLNLSNAVSIAVYEGWRQLNFVQH
jgi:tRNA (cytidine/uridine-2'-O-)-methyltransferase